MDDREKKQRDELIALKRIKQGQGENVFEGTGVNHEIEIPKTPRQRLSRYWYYYGTATLAAAVFAAIFLYLQFVAFKTEKHDVNIIFAAAYRYSSAEIWEIESQLVKYADDYNGDGKTVVNIEFIQYPSIMKLTAILSFREDFLFIFDDTLHQYLDESGGFDDAFIDLSYLQPRDQGDSRSSSRLYLEPYPAGEYFGGIPDISISLVTIEQTKLSKKKLSEYDNYKKFMENITKE
ncbi:MAG: hypothetical protein FWH14_04800 [Oscillospiraceae bacterium]|nr:hypothetical protein [Oscillospiraceae bacterium]